VEAGSFIDLAIKKASENVSRKQKQKLDEETKKPEESVEEIIKDLKKPKIDLKKPKIDLKKPIVVVKDGPEIKEGPNIPTSPIKKLRSEIKKKKSISIKIKTNFAKIPRGFKNIRFIPFSKVDTGLKKTVGEIREEFQQLVDGKIELNSYKRNPRSILLGNDNYRQLVNGYIGLSGKKKKGLNDVINKFLELYIDKNKNKKNAGITDYDEEEKIKVKLQYIDYLENDKTDLVDRIKHAIQKHPERDDLVVSKLSEKSDEPTEVPAEVPTEVPESDKGSVLFDEKDIGIEAMLKGGFGVHGWKPGSDVINAVNSGGVGGGQESGQFASGQTAFRDKQVKTAPEISNTRTRYRYRDRRPFFIHLGSNTISETKEKQQQDIDAFANFSWVPKDGGFEHGDTNQIVKANNDMDDFETGLDYWLPETPNIEKSLDENLESKLQIPLIPGVQEIQKMKPQGLRANPGLIRMYPINIQGMGLAVPNLIENRLIFPNVVDGQRL